LGNFFHGKCYELSLTKNGLGYILGDFFTNPSGHPGRESLKKFSFPEKGMNKDFLIKWIPNNRLI
jgi:hypothetical protein